LAKIAEEAAKKDSTFTDTDRLGLIHDILALSKAGLADLSSALTVIESLKNETQCAFRIFFPSKAYTDVCRSRLGWHR